MRLADLVEPAPLQVDFERRHCSEGAGPVEGYKRPFQQARVRCFGLGQLTGSLLHHVLHRRKRQPIPNGGMER